MNETRIAETILTHLETVANNMSPPLQVLWPNRSYDVPPVAPYLRATILPADTTWTSSDTDRSAGILQVDVFHKVDIGELAPLRIADQVLEAFKYDTRIDTDEEGVQVQVHLPPSRLRLIEDNPWAIVPVRIPWVCFYPRGE